MLTCAVIKNKMLGSENSLSVTNKNSIYDDKYYHNQYYNGLWLFRKEIHGLWYHAKIIDNNCKIKQKLIEN